MKLTEIEKIDRKCLLDMLKACKGKIGKFGRVTVVIVPTCRGKVKFTVAICSANEKFNRKRGELVALLRWNDGKTLPMENIDIDCNLENTFANIAMLVSLV